MSPSNKIRIDSKFCSAGRCLVESTERTPYPLTKLRDLAFKALQQRASLKMIVGYITANYYHLLRY